jgi:hypothetical protein
MKKIILIITCLMISTYAQAKFEVHGATGFNSNTDGKTKNSFTDMTYIMFIGASVDNKEKWLIGPSVSSVSTTYKLTTTDKLATTEIGSRLMYFFNEERNFFISVTWNPYASGKRTATSVEAEISGWSYLATFGALMKTNSNFLLGGSLNYHSMAVSKGTVGTTTTKESTTYSSVMPMLNLAYRFR